MKAILIERASDIRAWLAPAPRAEIIKLVSALTTVMKLKNWNEETSGAILQTYALDLADQPLFAIQDACTAYRRLLVGDGWMPQPGELLVEAKRKTEWVKAEAVEINRILDAEIVTEAPRVERASVRARADALMEELRAARTKIEIARGFDLPKEAADSRTPEQRLAETAKAYRDNPTTLSFAPAPRRAA